MQGCSDTRCKDVGTQGCPDKSVVIKLFYGCNLKAIVLTVNKNCMANINRRSFLKDTSLVTAGIVATNLFKLPVFAAANFNSESPVATTKYGQVRGYTDSGINVFRGIPYGADTSVRRFKSPLPPQP